MSGTRVKGTAAHVRCVLCMEEIGVCMHHSWRVQFSNKSHHVWGVLQACNLANFMQALCAVQALSTMQAFTHTSSPATVPVLFRNEHPSIDTDGCS